MKSDQRLADLIGTNRSQSTQITVQLQLSISLETCQEEASDQGLAEVKICLRDLRAKDRYQELHIILIYLWPISQLRILHLCMEIMDKDTSMNQ